MKRYMIVGAGAYIAPRHLKAISDTNGCLIAASDIHDNVGILDSFFPKTQFFSNTEQLFWFAKQQKPSADYWVICSPNHLHAAHTYLGLYSGSDVICEKPLVLNEKDIDSLLLAQKETGKKVYNILQVRQLESIKNLKKNIAAQPNNKTFDVSLKYITSRGNWYTKAWKNYSELSGGICLNLGIHFFDLLIWLFGNPTKIKINSASKTAVKGTTQFERANAEWFLSTDSKDLPCNHKAPSYRSLLIDNKEIEFSSGFKDAHTQVYQDILAGKGLGLEEAKASILLVNNIQNAINQQ